MRPFLFAVLLCACGLEPAPDLAPEGTGTVKVLPAVHCSCEDQGRTSFLPGPEDAPTLVICAPACTPVGETPLGPNVGTCTAIIACLNCCHWLTPKELGL